MSMLKMSRALVPVLVSLGLAACSGSEYAVDPPSVEDFSVRLDEEELKTWDAVASFYFYRDGGVGVDLAFQVGQEPVRTSLVLSPSIEQVRERSFDVELLAGSLVEGSGGWFFVDGALISDGTVSVTIEPGGRISGETRGTTPHMTFSGNYGFGCSVPPGSLGKSEADVPVPVAWDGNPRSLSLMGDSELASAECDELRRMLHFP
jgi:hypothetical protein